MFCRFNACYEELPVCTDCIANLQTLLDLRCKNCQKSASACDCPDKDDVRFLFFYDHPLARKVIYNVKIGADKATLDFLVELLFRSRGINPKRYDGVAFVPRRKNGIRRYGYDQAEEIAKAVSRVYGIEKLDALERIGKDEQKLLSQGERLKNIKNRYRLKEGIAKKYKRILLVDDVYTTGATVKVCAGLLRGTVSESVVPIVLAKTNFLRK